MDSQSFGRGVSDTPGPTRFIPLRTVLEHGLPQGYFVFCQAEIDGLHCFRDGDRRAVGTQQFHGGVPAALGGVKAVADADQCFSVPGGQCLRAWLQRQQLFW